MREVWAEVVIYGTRFRVSSHGMIQAIGGRKGPYRGVKDTSGYMTTRQSRKAAQGPRKMIRVHRLVAQAFIENPKGLDSVNHKNGDKTDNRVENLEWVTRGENSRHGWQTGLIDLRRAVVGIPVKGAVGYYLPMVTAAVEIGISPGNIPTSMKRNGTTGGCRWEYVSG